MSTTTDHHQPLFLRFRNMNASPAADFFFGEVVRFRFLFFDSCFSTEVLPDGLYQLYLHEIITELHEAFPESSFLAFNFQEGEKRSQFAEILWLKNPKPEQHSGNEESANLCQVMQRILTIGNALNQGTA
ncbi:hypothetical protein ACSBR2_035719 [Camellia fascicularis]